MLSSLRCKTGETFMQCYCMSGNNPATMEKIMKCTMTELLNEVWATVLQSQFLHIVLCKLTTSIQGIGL